VFTKVEGLPAGVIGVKASGEVVASDYTEVLLPMMEEARATGDKVRLLYVLGEDVEVTGGGAWADTKLGVQHFTSFERIAVVTDKDWLENAVKALGWIIPGEVRTFDDDDQDDAVEWLAGD
jgi:hypothetical protein